MNRTLGKHGSTVSALGLGAKGMSDFYGAADRTESIATMPFEGLSLGKDINTDCSINGDFKGYTYCFGGEQAKTDFMKDPEGNLAKAQAYYSNKGRF
jgi:hypothetical protein